MSPKDKKHKSPKRVASQAEASAKDTTQNPPRPAARVAAFLGGARKDSGDKKRKVSKATVVTTKKPSRFRFFVDAFLELKKAHWPSRKETTRLSIMVFFVCVVVGALLGGLDFVFMKMMGLVLVGG